MNKVFIIGRLTKEPELRTTPNGVNVATMSVAVTRRMNREQADFFNVIAWRGLADNCAKYLVNDGSKRYVTEIQADDIEFLAKPGAASTSTDSFGGMQEVDYESEDELPF